ncbi:MAG: serine protease [Lachnospiraceae bacterium]|nr:serine protease [Lachnospiraceae bacterium]
MTRMGCDVLLLQSRADIDEEDDAMGLSKKVELGPVRETEIPEYLPQNTKKQEEKTPSVPAPRNEDSGQSAAIRIQLPPRRRTRPAASNPAASSAGLSASGAGTISAGQSASGMGTSSAVSSASGAGTISAGLSASGMGISSARSSASISAAAFTRPGATVPASRTAVQRPAQQETEKTFEELALLASSVVLIVMHDRKGEAIGSGSGIMIGRDGYILTNNHVASGGRYYSVRIEDDETVYKTDEVIKYNPVLDLAVIRIDRQLTPLPIYQGKKKLVRGQRVVAIGSPLGLFNSVSDGIISGFRSINNVDMIQFTAPTSHGSSGGAVLNMFGEVIGISTAGFDSGQNINLAMGYECINMFVRGFV